MLNATFVAPLISPTSNAQIRWRGHTYRTNVPRDSKGNPAPLKDAKGPHSRLQPDAKNPDRTYSATEFNEKRGAVKRIDFAGRKGEQVPHEHKYNPETKGFGDKQPLPD